MFKYIDNTNFETQYLPVFTEAFYKYAGESNIYIPEEISKCIKNLQPRKDGVYIHLVALGAGDYYGPNRKGDHFPEWSLLGQMPDDDVVKRYKKAGIKIPKQGEYGIATFTKYGYVYANHNNSHPRLAKGEKVVCAAYNMKQHRVELIVFIKKDLAPEIVAKAENGESIPFSMGCKIPADQCSICGNLARTTRNYCDHARDFMGRVYQGREVYVINHFPKFIDISYVNVPADPTAFSISKVAGMSSCRQIPDQHLKEFSRALNHQLSKKATMEKNIINENDVSILGKEPIKEKKYKQIKKELKNDKSEEISPKILKAIRKLFGKKTGLKGLTRSGIILKPSEMGSFLGSDSFPSSMGSMLSSIPNGFKDLLKRIKPGRSLFGPDLKNRARKTIIIIKKPLSLQKKASDSTMDQYHSWLDNFSLQDIENFDLFKSENFFSEKEKIANYEYTLSIDEEDMRERLYLPFKVKINLTRNS